MARSTVNGRVTALLELGAGFHPDLTGAENVRVNAAMMGMTRRQMTERFEEIVDFSGVREFIDEPLRVYSAGHDDAPGVLRGRSPPSRMFC